MPKLHENHLDALDANDIKVSSMPSKNEQISAAQKIGEISVESHKIEWRPEVDNQLPFVTEIADIDHYGIKAKKENENSNEPDCYGHICPECGVFWTHTRRCWPDVKIKESMYCQICFGQASADIHRQADITALDQYVQGHCIISDVKSLKSAELEHAEWCGNEIRTNPDFDFDAHINDLRAKGELINSQISGTATAKRKHQEELDGKLTQEEIAEYRKNATRSKAKKVRDDSADKSKAKKEWNETLKMLLMMQPDKVKAVAHLTALYASEGKQVPSEIN